jgi:serine protease Do
MGRSFKTRAVAVAVALGLSGIIAPNLAPVPAYSQAQALPDVADLVDRVLPAVVEIAVETKLKGGATPTPPQLPDDSPFKDFFDDFLKRQGENPGGDDRTVSGMGSGFIIDPTGLVVTNNHVVEGAVSIEVHMQNGENYKGELVGRDVKTDLAVVRIKPTGTLPSLSFGNSDGLRIGQWVMAIGNPFGLGGSVSLGIVSARNRDINAGPYDDFIQTDAAINKGNSGGPLFNVQGEVMGVNTAIFSPTGGSVGIGFSVPANTAKVVVAQLVKYGKARRGWLGVKLQSITDDISQSMSLPSKRGALIADVTKDGPSAKAGVEVGDVITEFDGKPITEMRALPRAVGETEVGRQVKIKVWRKGQSVDLAVELGLLDEEDKTAAATPAAGADTTSEAKLDKLGMTVNTLTAQLRMKFGIADSTNGVVVTAVADGSVAADKKLEPGDVVLEAGGKKVATSGEIVEALDGAVKAGRSSLLLLVAKGGKESETRFFALKLPK